MTTLWAFLLDAYRQLNARKLFWVTLVISGLVVVGYGSIGFNEEGLSLAFGLKQIPSEYIHEGSPWARALYMGLFSDFIVGLWLAWAATILALISTTTIFPDLMESGSIDLVLSKPIRRTQLFIIKYCTSLLFVILQVSVFCAGVFLSVGWRIDEWNWKIFLGIPIVTLFFSYLYSVNVLIAVISRSALAALLLTILLWFGLFSLNATEIILKKFQIQTGIELNESEGELARLNTRLDALDPSDEAARSRVQASIDETEETITTRTGLHDYVTSWHGRVNTILTPLPKTSLTIDLMSRTLKDPEGFDIVGMMSGEMHEGSLSRARDVERRATREYMDYYESISWTYIIGSSLMFEVFILVIAAIIFVRRDY